MSTTIQAESALNFLQTASSSDLRARVSQAGAASAGAEVHASDVSVFYHAREYGDEVQTYDRSGFLDAARDRMLTAISEKSTAAIAGMKEEYGRFLEGVKSQAPDLAASYMKFGLGSTRFGFSLDTKGDLVAVGYDLTARDKNRLTQMLNQNTALKGHVLAFYNAAREFEVAAGWAMGNRITPENFQRHDIGAALEFSMALSDKSSGAQGMILNLPIHNININLENRLENR